MFWCISVQIDYQIFFYCRNDGYIILHLFGELKGDILCQYGFWFECFNLNFATELRPNSDHLLNKLIGIDCSNIGFSMTHLLQEYAVFYTFWSRSRWRCIDFTHYGGCHVTYLSLHLLWQAFSSVRWALIFKEVGWATTLVDQFVTEACDHHLL